MSDVGQKPARPLFRVLEPLLTTQRLAPYLAAANGNEKLALQLFQWNIETSVHTGMPSVCWRTSQRQRRTRTAQPHFDVARYREAVLSARLNVKTACGGRAVDVRRRLADAPADVADAGAALMRSAMWPSMRAPRELSNPTR